MVPLGAWGTVSPTVEVCLVAVLITVVAGRADASARGRIAMVRSDALTVVDALDALASSVTDPTRAWMKHDLVCGHASTIRARDGHALERSRAGALGRAGAFGGPSAAPRAADRHISSRPAIAAALRDPAIATVAIATPASPAEASRCRHSSLSTSTSALRLRHEHPWLDPDEQIATGRDETRPSGEKGRGRPEARESSHPGAPSQDTGRPRPDLESCFSGAIPGRGAAACNARTRLRYRELNRPTVDHPHVRVSASKQWVW